MFLNNVMPDCLSIMHCAVFASCQQQHKSIDSKSATLNFIDNKNNAISFSVRCLEHSHNTYKQPYKSVYFFKVLSRVHEVSKSSNKNAQIRLIICKELIFIKRSFSITIQSLGVIIFFKIDVCIIEKNVVFKQ